MKAKEKFYLRLGTICIAIAIFISIIGVVSRADGLSGGGKLSSITDESSAISSEEVASEESNNETATSNTFETPTVMAAGDVLESYDLVVISDSTKTNGVKYQIQNVQFASGITSLGSVSITFPTQWQYNSPSAPGSSWTVNSSTAGTVSISVTNPGTEGTVTIVKNYLENSYFTISTVNTFPTDNSKVTINATEQTQATFVDSNGFVHTYQYVSFAELGSSTGVPWLTCYNYAKSLPSTTGYTSKGYLATITSIEEQNLIYNNITKQCGWLGGTRMVNNVGKTKINDENSISTVLGAYDFNTANGNKWYWADGPEAACRRVRCRYSPACDSEI